MPAGTLEALAIRPAGSSIPRRVDIALALAGTGLAGDRHADPHSPRQLLLAGAGIYDSLALAPHALRENLLVDLDTSLLTSGTVLQVGPEVTLRLMFQCEACGQLDLQRPGLAARVRTHRGMLARVLSGGTVRPGDAIEDLGRRMPAWSDDWRERVVQVLDAVPDGMAVAYRDLARLAGIQSSYCRAFPRLLAKLGPVYAGRAVAASAAPSLPRWAGTGLFI
ncbi:MOSC domain-containing protein [Telluria aromaticivorans]|uniref:MOSC domain-containing protein n=1 Tax=Telluria aromaticivorans TaxID=2725995 RepID=UPI001E51CB37|nr:MOSC domain-containing protein [Telluria aromaticivorans]